MKIIIIGDGKVGYSLAENLSMEHHDVTIIDKDSDALEKAEENLDVMCIRGNGVSAKTLMEAGVRDADLLIAATTSDEMNMVCCLTAKKLGAKHTIARIRNVEYAEELTMLKNELELDMIINPEQAAAYEIAKLLSFSSAVNIEDFAKGKIEMVEIKVTADVPIVGMKISDISDKIFHAVLIGAVVRDDQVMIPNGDFTILKNDTLYIMGTPSNVSQFCNAIGKYNEKINNVMIVGGGRIAYYLNSLMAERGIKVKIIESDEERCRELSEIFPKTLVIHGDGTDQELLESENMSDMDAFISLTGRDEDNLMLALLAKQSHVKKVIAKINRVNYLNVIKNLGLDNVISPKTIITDHIVKYVRGLQNAQGSSIEALYRIVGGQAEVVEFKANSSTKYLNVPLKNIRIEKDVLITTIVRKNEIIVPHGNDVIKEGDRVVLVTKDKNLSDLNQIFVSGGLHSELQSGIKNFGNSVNM